MVDIPRTRINNTNLTNFDKNIEFYLVTKHWEDTCWKQTMFFSEYRIFTGFLSICLDKKSGNILYSIKKSIVCMR